MLRYGNGFLKFYFTSKIQLLFRRTQRSADWWALRMSYFTGLPNTPRDALYYFQLREDAATPGSAVTSKPAK